MMKPLALLLLVCSLGACAPEEEWDGYPKTFAIVEFPPGVEIAVFWPLIFDMERNISYPDPFLPIESPWHSKSTNPPDSQCIGIMIDILDKEYHKIHLLWSADGFGWDTIFVHNDWIQFDRCTH